MSRQLKKPAKPEEPDLLPAMGLFTILIPMLLSMAAFSKLAIVEMSLPERSAAADSQPNEQPDDQALNLAVFIKPDHLLVGSTAVQLPKIFFKERWVFRCKSDSKLIRYYKSDVEKSKSLKCQDGSDFEIDSDMKYLNSLESIELLLLGYPEGLQSEEEFEAAPKHLVWGLHTSSGEGVPDEPIIRTDIQSFVMVDGADAIGATAPSLTAPAGAQLETLMSKRNLLRSGKNGDEAKKAIVYPLSAYDSLAKLLVAINAKYNDFPDGENIVIGADNDTQFDKIVQVMDRAKASGFGKMNLVVIGGED